jgi:hypothetical protein
LKMLADLKNETTKQLQQLESDWTATKYVLWIYDIRSAKIRCC